MTLDQLLNPFSFEEERKFTNTLENSKQQRQRLEQNLIRSDDNNVGSLQNDITIPPALSTSSSSTFMTKRTLILPPELPMPPKLDSASNDDSEMIVESYGVLSVKFINSNSNPKDGLEMILSASESSGHLLPYPTRNDTPRFSSPSSFLEEMESEQELPADTDDEEVDTEEEDDIESEEEEEEEEDNDKRIGSPSRRDKSPTKTKSTLEDLHKLKIERIVHKAEKVIKQLNLPKAMPVQAILEQVIAVISYVAPIKIRKRTVNQTTAAAIIYALKKLKVTSISPLDVLNGLKRIEKSHNLSRSAKPIYSRNHAEILGITKIVTSLENNCGNSNSNSNINLQDPSSPTTPYNNYNNISNNNNNNNPSSPVSTPIALAPASHAKSTADATKKLCEDLCLGPEITEMACKFASLSEDSSLASRHNISVAASCVLVAAKNLKKKLTLTRVSEVSGVSGCTIRKAQKALSAVLEKGHEE